MIGVDRRPMLRIARPFTLGALLVVFSGGTLAARGPAPIEPPRTAASEAPPPLEEAARRAREEAEAGSLAFGAGDFLAAGEHFGRAVALDPSRPAYGVLRARALAELVARDDASPENLARLKTVVTIYEELLATDPANEEYAQAVASLYAKVGDDAGREAWLLQRAGNHDVPAGIRADALRAAAEAALAAAVREQAAGRRGPAAALAARARVRLDEAVALAPDEPSLRALLLHVLELEVAIARQRKDAPQAARLGALLSRAKRGADAAIGRARLKAATPPDDY